MENSRDDFWDLLKPEYKKTMMFCRKLMGSIDSGDDLFQDALVQAYQNFSQLRDVSAFNAWLYRIIVNAFKSKKRRSFWKRFTSLTEQALHIPGETDPEKAYGHRQTLEIALNAVSPEHRVIIIMHEVEGWPVKDISEIIGKTEGAVKAGLFRARNKMKRAVLNAPQSADRKSRAVKTERKGAKCIAAKSSLK